MMCGHAHVLTTETAFALHHLWIQCTMDLPDPVLVLPQHPKDCSKAYPATDRFVILKQSALLRNTTGGEHRLHPAYCETWKTHELAQKKYVQVETDSTVLIYMCAEASACTCTMQFQTRDNNTRKMRCCQVLIPRRHLVHASLASPATTGSAATSRSAQSS